MLERFVALYDLHYGSENRNGHKVFLHDEKAMSVALQFCKDFKPDHVILGGDILDSGCISHHNHGKPGAVEGMRLLKDAQGCRDEFLKPIEDLKAKSYTYIVGNHEDWLNDLTEKIPALGEMLDIRTVLSLDKRWKVIPNGEAHKLGKLVFVHGDQIKGGENCAKWATLAYEANIRFGHFHTAQLFTKTSAIEMNGHTGMCIPCLCKKGPKYGGGSPNRWMQGFAYGYIDTKTGVFADYLVIIVNGQSIINGKYYNG